MTLTGSLRRAFAPPGATGALEITSTHVAAATIARDRDGIKLSGHAITSLPAGAVTPDLAGQNIHDRDAVAAAIMDVLGQLPRRPIRIGLTVPDAVAKVSFVRLEHVPPRSTDLDRLIAWQVRKTAPFRLEDAQMAYTEGRRHGDAGREFIVALARREIVQEYESACDAAAMHAGVVDLTVFNLVNSVLAQGPKTESDWLLMHVSPTYCTFAIMRGQHLMFLRNRPTRAAVDLPDVVHQTAMYYKDHLAGSASLARAILVDTSGGAAPDPTLQPMLADRLQAPVEDGSSAQGSAWAADLAPGLAAHLAGPVGLLWRDRLAE